MKLKSIYYSRSFFARLMRKLLQINFEKKYQWMDIKNSEKYYMIVENQNNLDKLLLELYVELINKFIPEKSNIADFGAGTGILTKMLKARGHTLTAIDVSESMLSNIKNQHHDVRIIIKDLFSDDLIDEQYDVVVSRWFFPHFKKWEKLIEKSSKTLIKGGHLFFDMPSKEHVEFAKKMGINVSPNAFGYNHEHAKESSFYAAVSDAELHEASLKYGMKFERRVPIGFFKRNMIIANSLGDEGFKNFCSYIESSSFLENREIKDRVFEIEKLFMNEASKFLVHNSIVHMTKS